MASPAAADEGRAVPQRRLPAAADLRAARRRLRLVGQRPTPLIWLSAYGLQEFNDMAKVYPIDRGVIDRTQNWLMKQQAAGRHLVKIGATHSETIASMGDPKLLLTSYVAWSLLDSGLQGAAAEEVDRVHPRHTSRTPGQRLHPGAGGQRPGRLGRQGRQHARRAGAQEARRACSRRSRSGRRSASRPTGSR